MDRIKLRSAIARLPTERRDSFRSLHLAHDQAHPSAGCAESENAESENIEKTMDPLQANMLKSVRQMKAGAVRVTRGKPPSPRSRVQRPDSRKAPEDGAPQWVAP
ncbi:hypothetical protein [Paraburkholderia flagellata]|uniref:hypothetical protein n=1 Tax=Paraburkholderia flagellata TaxID=2883241 RepID=UPI001F4491B1|nr:hypothetical protein [Paraburkholderia flagellata]